MRSVDSIRVIHTVSTLRADYGGPGRSITSLCSALTEHVNVDLISYGYARGEEPPVMPKAKDVRVHLIEQHGPLLGGLTFGVRFRNAVRRTVRDAGDAPVMLHDHGLWLRTNHATASVSHRLGVARIVSPRGMISKWAMDFHRTKKRVAWTLYQERDLRAARLIHATSDDEADDVRRLELRVPVAVVPNGVELPSAPLNRARTSGKRTALFLSRIHPKKGVLELIRAWARTRPPGWTLVIAGPDDNGHRGEAEALVKREGLGALITFTGSVPNDDKWRLYADADLFILPTFSENFGIAIAEALGSGLPVITTTGAPWRVLKDLGGWWIDTGIEPLAAAISDATSMSDDERWRRGRRGQDYVSREFSWSSIGARMAAVYAWVSLGGSAPPDVWRD